MDLFDYMRKTNQENDSPLAMRLRPRTLEEVVGHNSILLVRISFYTGL